MSLIDDIQLIEEVKKYPLLYDNKFRGYHAIKDKAWINIAGKLNVKPVEAKNRWRSLRDRFVREKKLISSGCESDQKSRAGPVAGPWPLLDHMSFIWDYIVHRRRFTTNSIKREPGPYSATETKRDLNVTSEWVVALDCENGNDRSHSDQNKNDDQDDLKMKKQNNQLLSYQEQSSEEAADFCHVSEDDRSHLQKVDHCLNSQSYVADEEHYFCMSVAETLRRFTSRQRAEAKLKIQQILYDIEFGPDSTENVTTFENTFME
ncbi:transcription factor Adf-1 [Cephus cinctus]|uniref:Transcription factor Adf-1 n=1 Tax=Cephus cinctus TaxID=211228 RepID=A0AAJ7C4A6_CEPCN|nr:transcription factor Adf-1 [Cephus cinctus]